jgi:hypothetical protein
VLRDCLRGIAIAALIAAAFATAAAAAEAPTREDYVVRLERICKPGAAATQRAMKGARAEVRRERFAAAAPKFARASSIFGGTIRRIAALPRPSADAARLRKWFGYLKQQESYLRKITAALRKSQGIKAQRLTARFIHNGNLANNVVLAFGFNYCSFKFSRYG